MEDIAIPGHYSAVQFLPVVADRAFVAPSPPRIARNSVGRPSRSRDDSSRRYTFLEAVELLGRLDPDPIELVYRRQVAKSAPPTLALPDLVEEMGHCGAALSFLADKLSTDGTASLDGRLPSFAKELLFYRVFCEVPTAGVARPTYDYPRVTIVPASPAWAAHIRAKLGDLDFARLAQVA